MHFSLLNFSIQLHIDILLGWMSIHFLIYKVIHLLGQTGSYRTLAFIITNAKPWWMCVIILSEQDGIVDLCRQQIGSVGISGRADGSESGWGTINTTVTTQPWRGWVGRPWADGSGRAEVWVKLCLAHSVWDWLFPTKPLSTVIRGPTEVTLSQQYFPCSQYGSEFPWNVHRIP